MTKVMIIISTTKFSIICDNCLVCFTPFCHAIGMHSCIRRQLGRVVRVPDLKSVGHGFKSRSDR